jgi:hypothetical protein
MIVSSAVQLEDGRVFVGRRHGDCYTHMMEVLNLSLNEVPIDNSVQGFQTDFQVFLNREDGYYHARKYNQCKEQFWKETNYTNGLGNTKEEEWSPCLISEHLWQEDFK